VMLRRALTPRPRYSRMIPARSGLGELGSGPEKSVKERKLESPATYLVLDGIEFPRVHDIALQLERAAVLWF
jgi:hypothetical protein